MPELPEVEVVKQSLVKNVKSQKILQVIVRNRNLRFKIPRNFKNIIKKQKNFSYKFKFLSITIFT